MSGRAALVVLQPGPLLLTQDGGRPGYAAMGVTGSGFMDRTSAALANRLVGNAPDECLWESVLGGVSLRATGASATLAVTGGPVEITVVDAEGCIRGFGAHEPVHVPLGGTVAIGSPRSALRLYIGVRGGLDPDPVLGSRSRDTLAGLGPEPAKAGDVMPVGRRAGDWPGVDLAVLSSHDQDPLRLPMHWGPREDWIDADSRRRLLDAEWTVSDRADRVGIRVTGEDPLHFVHGAQLPSEGTVLGAIEVPPDGNPFILMADHPVTVGYPVVGVVVDRAALDRLAQTRPGQVIRFVDKWPAALGN